MSAHQLYGRIVTSDFPLHLPPTDGTPDLRFRLTRLTKQPASLPEGEVIVDYQDRGARWYAVARRPDGSLLFRVFRQADITISPGRDDVEFAVLDDTDPGMASVFATGAVPSLLLSLDGTPVLHASGVTADDGTTVAFLGRSGQGKSTLATLLCLAGGALLTDDVLPVVGRDPVTVAAGSSEVRLREQAHDLVDGDDVRWRTSADARKVVAFREPTADPGPRRLDAIFVPLPNREGILDVLRISKQQAHLTVMRYPRLLGWKDPAVIRSHFDLATAIAEHVPVILARVPWGPPFRDDIATVLWRAARDPNGVKPFVAADQPASPPSR